MLSPITSFQAAAGAIDAGADEIYCDVYPPNLKDFMIYRGASCAVPSYDELGKITKYAHERERKVLFIMNVPFLVETMRGEITKHIRAALEEDVDALIVGDLGTLATIREISESIPVVASTYTMSINYESVEFLRKQGFSRVVLERHLQVDELKEIVRRSKVEVEVFIHGIGCSNINGSCYFLHYSFPEIVKAWRSTATLQAPCTFQYDLYDAASGNLTAENISVQDALTACSICKLSELIDTGVAGLKIADRSLSAEYQINTTKMYRELIDLVCEGRIGEYRERVEWLKDNFFPLPREPLTLREMFCEQSRCYYSPLFNAPYKTPLSWTAWTKFKLRTRVVARP